MRAAPAQRHFYRDSPSRPAGAENDHHFPSRVNDVLQRAHETPAVRVFAAGIAKEPVDWARKLGDSGFIESTDVAIFSSSAALNAPRLRVGRFDFSLQRRQYRY